MRLPNGYGSVYLLKGNRRKPWAARKTTGWKIVNGKTYPVYYFVGYFATKSEALQALAVYNNDPFQVEDITLGELYERWSEEHYETVSEANARSLTSVWKICEPIKDKKITDLKLVHFQTLFDRSGKNQPTLKKLKTELNMIYGYGVKYEMIPKDRKDMISYITIKAGNPKAKEHIPFSVDEIEELWTRSDDEYIMVVLMLIYTGLRVGELLNLKSEDVHLKERWLYVRQSKTIAGVREVPIAEKIVPFFEHWLKDEFLIQGYQGTNGRKRFYNTQWKPRIPSHRPHDTRHTCISMLVSQGVDSRIVKQIVGHAGSGVTDNIYTHIDMALKLDAINKL